MSLVQFLEGGVLRQRPLTIFVAGPMPNSLLRVRGGSPDEVRVLAGTDPVDHRAVRLPDLCIKGVL